MLNVGEDANVIRDVDIGATVHQSLVRRDGSSVIEHPTNSRLTHNA